MTARWPKSKIISNEKIQAGDVIVGFASYGQAAYEQIYNSGIGSNGLTSARHDALDKSYGLRFPESYDASLDEQVVYIGPHKMTDKVAAGGGAMSVGSLLLSPTRTYAPLLTTLLEQHFDALHGIIHCSGGGQTKCLKYLPAPLRVIKDKLFEAPVIFDLIQKASGADKREMYQVFNMGHRLEIFTSPSSANALIAAGAQYGIEARIVGRVEPSAKKELTLQWGSEQISF
jgi:phosphoribosylformylglycinamidine cyclo-ligase